MQEHRVKRNQRIKKDVIMQLEIGLNLKEALVVVGERWYLSPRHVETIYYNTILEEE